MLLPAQFSGIRVRQVVPNCTQVLYFPPSHHLQPMLPSVAVRLTWNPLLCSVCAQARAPCNAEPSASPNS